MIIPNTKYTNPKYQVHYPNYQNYTILDTKHITPNTKYTILNTKYTTPNTEYQ